MLNFSIIQMRAEMYNDLSICKIWMGFFFDKQGQTTRFFS